MNNLLAAYTDKSAKALCTFAYCAEPGSPVVVFEGITEGTIVSARGPNNFGWDPGMNNFCDATMLIMLVFEPKGFKTTYKRQKLVARSLMFFRYAEMSVEEKNTISHRYPCFVHAASLIS